MIRTKSLKYNYSESVQLSFPDLQCDQGDTLLILGKSGVGKTTILHLLGGLMQPAEGEIEIGNQNLALLNGAALDEFRGKNIGIIFQKNHFVSALNVEENLALAQKLATGKVNEEQIHEILSQLNISHKADSSIKNLSEGEKQRVAIARALVKSPQLILADEPTSALDDDNCNTVLELLNEQSKKVNASLIIVTHDGRLKSQISNKIQLG